MASTRSLKLLTVAASTIFALALGEVALRLLFPAPVVSDPILGVKLQPGGEYDRRGFRNAEALDEAAIVAIGDSQTEGNNATAAEAWPQVLAQLAATTTYQVAVPGWGPAQYRYILDQTLELKPSTVVVGLYLGNDLLDTVNRVYGGETNAWARWRRPDFTLDGSNDSGEVRMMLESGYDRGSLKLAWLKARWWVRRHSRLYELLGNGTRSIREAIGISKTTSEKIEGVSQWADEHPETAFSYDREPIRTLLSPAYRRAAVDLTQPNAAEGWRLTQEALTEMASLLAERHVRLLVAIIPTKELVYGRYSGQLGETLSPEMDQYLAAEETLHGAVIDFCRSRQLSCIATIDELVASLARGEAAYGVTLDGHPKALGYRAIAEAINRALATSAAPESSEATR